MSVLQIRSDGVVRDGGHRGVVHGGVLLSLDTQPCRGHVFRGRLVCVSPKQSGKEKFQLNFEYQLKSRLLTGFGTETGI